MLLLIVKGEGDATKAKKFICNKCGYSTNIKSRLIDHVNSVHLKINNESIYKMQSLPKLLALYPIFDTISNISVRKSVPS